MNLVGSQIAEAAEKLVGCPFRLYGRDPAAGLDCVGVVLLALRRTGQGAHDLQGYGLRNLAIDRHIAFAAQLGLLDARGATEPGDVLLFRLSAAQFHLGVVNARGGLIHAHAGLRRVVTTSQHASWPIERHWRLAHD